MTVYVLMESSGSYDGYYRSINSIYSTVEKANIAKESYNNFLQADAVRYSSEQKAELDREEDELYAIRISEENFPAHIKEFMEWRSRSYEENHPAWVEEYKLL